MGEGRELQRKVEGQELHPKEEVQVQKQDQIQMEHQPLVLGQGLNEIQDGGLNELRGLHEGKGPAVRLGLSVTTAGEGELRGRGYCARRGGKLCELEKKQ